MEHGFKPFHAAFRVLFNSYYNGVGEKHPRPQRGLLTRPSMEEVRAYRANVDERMAMQISAGITPELASLITLGLQHEQQHQELMLTDVKHLLAQNPLMPAYRPVPPPAADPAGPLSWHAFEGGLADIGYGGDGFCFDNELPRHRTYVAPFELGSRLVTNGEYLAFVEAGGYRDPSLWLAEGWDWVNAQRLSAPIYWLQREHRWHEFTLHGVAPLDLRAPAAHLSMFEADAYARWAGARLPTEAEWEVASADQRMHQLFGHCWQWTSSSYSAYPGYRPVEGALGEYNGKFMVNQYVLRGSSQATPSGHARASYRNFFPATARWQFTGIRLAR
jgi:ergothioneine biosynthesis protein EgtB